MKLRSPDLIDIITENGILNEKDRDATIDIVLVNNSLTVKITADSTPLCYIKLKWLLSDSENRDRNSVKVLGDTWERGYGDLEWRPICKDRTMPWYFTVSNGSDSLLDYKDRFTECFGVKVQPSSFCHWNYSTEEIILTLDIRNGGSGVILKGRTLTAAEIIFAEYNEISAYESIRLFCKQMCSVGIFPKSPVFGFNDWYFSYGESNRQMIIESARMLTGRSELYSNTPYMVVDDGWQSNFNDGPWDRCNESFRDMAQLAKEISDMGACPGIWIRPLQQKHENPNIPQSWRSHKNSDALDPSNPEVLKYVAQCIERIVNWGFRLIKYDFVTYDIFKKWAFECPVSLADEGWHFQDTSLTTAEIILNLYKTIRDAAGDTVLIGCNTVSHLCAGLVELNRTGDDTSGKEWERTLKMGVNTLAFRSPQNNIFYSADADCVGITNSIPFELNQKWLYALSVSGSPTFISVSPSVSDTAIKAAIFSALERNSKQNDTFAPLDWMETKTPTRWLLNGEEIQILWNKVQK